MLIWRGWGISVIAIVVVFQLVAAVISEALLPATTSQATQQLATALALFAAAAVLWRIGRRLHSRPTRVLIDKETGERFELRPNHSFYFIKLEYWGIIAALLGIGLIINILI